MLRAICLATVGAAGYATAFAVGVAPAVADSQVTVRGVGFPEGRTAQLSMVGCASLYDRTDETLAPFIGRGPDQAPLGTRSLGYDLTGGNAVGSVHYVQSMLATTTAELSVHAREGATGVAYAGYQAPGDSGTDDVWIGRASLSASAGSWTQVAATGLSYTWTKYDMGTRQVIPTAWPPRVATVAEVIAGAGDGAGFYSIGFGCDGGRFSMDAWRVGGAGDVTSYDLEGLTTETAIEASAHAITKGEDVTLTGRVRLGMGDRMARATLMLESKPVGGDDFELVAVMEAAASDPTIVVSPKESTVYRWRFVDRPLAEGSRSERVVVTVLPAGQPEPSESPGPTETPNPTPTVEPTPTFEPTPTVEPTPPIEPTPSDEPTPTETVSAPPDESPTP